MIRLCCVSFIHYLIKGTNVMLMCFILYKEDSDIEVDPEFIVLYDMYVLYDTRV